MSANSLRKHRLRQLYTFTPPTVEPSTRITAIFEQNVFTMETASKYLTKQAYKELKSAAHNHKIDRSVADDIACGLKVWAMEHGVTHYTHWFQPLTGKTAEKHDTFFSIDFSTGKGIEKLDGDTLIQQEPDASSFPSGGLRATFEARGYTAWDPSSPAFIIDGGGGKTLCIPTVFISYNGESLDYKAPLLRSCDALNKVAVEVAHLFDKNVTRVSPTLGWEQEYFLVDAGLAQARPDIVMAGRTLLGSSSAKNQQLEDHYFGSIPSRVYQFMRDFETEAYKLGIPLKTRHNEVAPAQFECAPIFEEVSVAVDHNVLLMDLMDRIGVKHGFKVLLHEKPFAGINGSGKHNNWSMSTDTGINLLAPGKTPKSNLMFLTFFISTIKAVHKHASLLQASIASAGNDYRLGANEAPPGIVSVFIGTFLSKVLDEIEERVTDKFDEQDQSILKIDIHKNIPEVLLDNTDRNRTSPFAFTGNKFEFRAVGSSANCAYPMTVMNLIMTDVLNDFLKDLKKMTDQGEKREVAILHILRDYIKTSKSIRFEKDGYSEDWVKEAKKRGLANIKNAPEAIEALVSSSAEELFKKFGVLDKNELHARYEIELDKYVKKVEIEAIILIEMLKTNVIPVSITFQQSLANTLKLLGDLGMKDQACEQYKLLEQINEKINLVLKNIESLQHKKEAIDCASKSLKETAKRYAEELVPMFIEAREPADALEVLVDDQIWRLPKYRELLNIR